MLVNEKPCIELMVRKEGNTQFKGILYKTGFKKNSGWKKRIFLIDPKEGFSLRYFHENSKLEVGCERGNIDIEDIFKIESKEDDRHGYIAINLHTKERIFNLSTQSMETAGTFIAVLANIVDIIGNIHMRTIAEDVVHADDGNVTSKGWLMKMGKVHRTWKRRYFILDTNRNLQWKYYEKETAGQTQEFFKGSIDLVDVLSIQNTQNDSVLKQQPYAFDVVTSVRTYHIGAENKATRDQWVGVLKRTTGIDKELDEMNQPIVKGIVQRHEKSQRRNIVNKAFLGLSRRVQKTVNEVEGYLVLTKSRVMYFDTPKRFDIWTRMTLMSQKFEFEENEVKIPIQDLNITRVTGYGQGKDRFAILFSETTYIFSCKSKDDTERWLSQISKVANKSVGVQPKY